MLLLMPLAENPLLPALPEIIAAVVFVLILTYVFTKAVVPRFEATFAERTAAIQGGNVWVEGHWDWAGGRWIWSEGFWIPASAGMTR